MKLLFEAPNGERLHRYGVWVKAFGLWWVDDANTWMTWEDYQASYPRSAASSSSPPVKTLKAFKRHVRKHSEILKQAESPVIWVNRYPDNDVFVVGW